MEYHALCLALYEVKEENKLSPHWNLVDMLKQIKFQENDELFKHRMEEQSSVPESVKVNHLSEMSVEELVDLWNLL